MVEHAQVHGLGVVDVLGRRVVAERDDLDPLQAHDAKRLRPAPIVADAHADDGVEGAPHFEAFVADLEVALFEVLEWRVGQMLGMARQMDLAITPDDPSVALDQDRRVVAAKLALLLRQLGIAEVKSDPERAGEVKQRLGFRPGHLAFEKAVDLLLVGHPIAWKEGRQRELREHDEAGTRRMRFAHHRH